MAALISSVMTTKDKVPFFVNRCEEMGIEVLPPDVNSSDHGFVVSGNAIRFGLDAVKNVGHVGGRGDPRARARTAPFASIWDFCERVDARAVNKRAIECLIKCGALDSTGDTRKGMLEALPAAQSRFGQKAQEDARLRAGLDLRPRRAGGRRSPAPSRQHHAADPAPRSSTSASCSRLEKETLGTYPLLAPARRGPRRAAGAGRLLALAASPSKPDGVLGDGRRDRHRVQEDPHRRTARR